MALALTGARIFDGAAMREAHAIIVEGDRIRDVVLEARLGSGLERRRLAGGILAPGFIDVQVNGGGGALLNNDPNVDTVRRIALSHRKFGTTGLLPTVITDAPSILAKAIAAVKGAHAARFIREMNADDVETIASADCGAIMLTLAPNRVKPEFVGALAQRGVLLSLGHAEASLAEANLALKSGARAFTHLYNAMSQMTGREPGMVGAALADTASYIGIIADGHHVHDGALKVALAATPKSRMMLISDAMATAAGGPDRFELQGRTVWRKDGRLQLDDGTLAGSNLTMDEAVRYCVAHLGVGLEDALRMASLNPASFLRRDDELGRVAPGYLASLVHLSDDLRVLETWIDGK